MKRLTVLFAVLITLSGCAPQATIEPEDPAFLRFVETPSYDLVVVANGPIDGGEVEVIGLELVIESPYCNLENCLPSEDGFIRLTFPEEPENAYPKRLEIDVVSGIPIKGRALMALEGEDVSREALLTLSAR